MKYYTALKNHIVTVLCYTCILLFVYAAVSKLIDYTTFESQLGQSPLLGAYAHWVAWLVPLIEILIAILLVFNSTRLIGLYGFFIMMVMFTAYIIIILNFTPFVPCSCGGVLEDLGWTEHLIFNTVFVLLSGLSIIYYPQLVEFSKRKVLLHLLLVTFLGSSSVIALFLGSEQQLKRNNAFIRKYMPHPIEKMGEYMLPSDAFYIAGIDDHNIYLGNYNAPLYLKRLTTKLTEVTDLRVSIDSMQLPYRKVRITVNPPYFYVGDGTVPIVFRGKISDGKANIFSYHDAYFSSLVIVDSLRIGITTTSTNTRYKALGFLNQSKDSLSVTIKEDLLSSATYPGSFEADGVLLWNEKHQRFVYIYFYQNRYELTDKNMSYISTGKTIDTVNKPILDIIHDTKVNLYKLGSKSIKVNRQSCTYGDYLYIHSDRLGKYEGEEVLRTASIVDVYRLPSQTYSFSFYLYHQPEQKLKGFIVYKNILIAIVADRLWIYRLKPDYFEAGL